MSALPDDGDLSVSQTQSEFKIKIESMRDIVAEQPGAVPQQTITIDGSGQITPPVGCRSLRVIVNTGSADDLGKIIPTNCHDGDQVELVADDPAKPITIKHLVTGDYQIALLGAKDYVMDDANKALKLQYYGGSAKIWREVSSGSRADELFRMAGYSERADVTVAGDVLTVDQFNSCALPQSSTADDIQEIIAAGAGLKLVLVGNATGNTMTFKHNTGAGGKVYMRDSAHLAMSLATQYVLFEMVGVDAYEVARFGFDVVDSGGYEPCIRLSLSTGVRVHTSDVSNQGTLYGGPFPGKGNRLPAYDSTTGKVTWRTFSEISLALSGNISSGQIKDVFARWNGSAWVLSLSTAWTNATTRATALAVSTHHGYYVKGLTGTDEEYLYVGSIRGTGSGTINHGEADRNVWNMFNRVAQPVSCFDNTDSWTTTSTYQEARGQSLLGTSRFGILLGLAEEAISLHNRSTVVVPSGNLCYIGIGIDSSSVNSAMNNFSDTFNYSNPLAADYDCIPGAGYRTYRRLEGVNAGGTMSVYGDNNLTAIKSGMTGHVFC